MGGGGGYLWYVAIWGALWGWSSMGWWWSMGGGLMWGRGGRRRRRTRYSLHWMFENDSIFSTVCYNENKLLISQFFSLLFILLKQFQVVYLLLTHNLGHIHIFLGFDSKLFTKLQYKGNRASTQRCKLSSLKCFSFQRVAWTKVLTSATVLNNALNRATVH